MTQPTSKVDICNLALDLLSAGTVTDIDIPSSDIAVILSRWYDSTRRALLRQHIWNFAKKRATLTRGGTPEFGYPDYYNLPNDFLRLAFIGDDLIKDYRTVYELEGRKILIDNSGSDSLNVGYIRDAKDVPEFDSLFIELLSYQLAVNIAFKITTKNTAVARVKTLKDELRQMAATIDGQERPPVRVESSRFSGSRQRMSTGASQYIDFGGQ